MATDPQFHAPLSEPGPAPAARWYWLLAAGQASMVTLLAVWLMSGKPLGIPGQWAWETRERPFALSAPLRALALGGAVIGLAWLGLQRLRARRSAAPSVAGLVALAFALQLAVASLAPQAGFYLVASTGSSISTEYFGVARGVSDPWAFCRTYAADMRHGHHVATHPPGAVLAYWLCLRAYHSALFPRESSDSLTEIVVGAPRDAIAAAARTYPGMALGPEDVGAALFCCLVLGLCGALTVVPIYLLAARAAGRSTAILAAALFSLTPAALLFFQGLDALVLLLSTSALALAYHALVGKRTWAGVLCGVLLGMELFVTFGATASVAMVALMGLFVVGRMQPLDRRGMWTVIGAGVLSLAAVVVTVHLLCGAKLHVIFAQAMQAHRQLTWQGFGRTYPTWVMLNGVEFHTFLGWPVALGAAAAAWACARRGRRPYTAAEAIGLAGGVVLLLLDLSGSVRGEVGRVWLFLMPPLIIWVAYWMRSSPRDKRIAAESTFLWMLVQLLVMGLTLTPVAMPY